MVGKYLYLDWVNSKVIEWCLNGEKVGFSQQISGYSMWLTQILRCIYWVYPYLGYVKLPQTLVEWEDLLLGFAILILLKWYQNQW